MAALATSRPPTRYTWYQHVPVPAAFTSSSEVPASVERM